MYYKNKQGKSKSMMGILVGVIVLGLAITGYFLYFQTEESVEIEAIDKEPLTIGISSWVGYAHAFIAEEKGFFEKNGVAVTLEHESDFISSQDRYRKGEVDGVFTLIADAILLDGEGIGIKIVYVADYSDTGDAIIGTPDINSLADLKGKRVSFDGFNSFSHVFVIQALEKAGLTEDDVFLENIIDNYLVIALDEGRVDAGHAGEPYLSQAENKGYKVLAYANEIGGIIDLLAFNPEVIEERPEDVKAFVKSMLEARDFIFSNREEAVKIMARGTGVTDEEMAPGIDRIRYLNLQENIEAMKKTDDYTSLFKSGEIIANFYLKRNLIPQMPDFDEIIEEDFVNALANE